MCDTRKKGRALTFLNKQAYVILYAAKYYSIHQYYGIHDFVS